MSQLPSDPIRPQGGPGHRPARVDLRAAGQEPGDSAALLDPAHQSLADALRITFYLLMTGLVAVFGLFLLSGFQTVKEGEVGVRLLFGEPMAEGDLEPGFRFSFPYPLGELIRVPAASPTTAIDEAFWPRLTDQQKIAPMSQLVASKPQLKPGEDGSLLTADRAIAHAKWSVSYRRTRPRDTIRNIAGPEQEVLIVRAAVERAVVHAVAQTPIDEFLKQSGEDKGAVARRAREGAQAILDRMESGITLDRLTLDQQAPPFSVYTEFTNVQSAEQQAGVARGKAEADARDVLNAVAGGAHGPLIARMDDYERAIERGDESAQAAALDAVLALMDGRSASPEGSDETGGVSGEVTRILDEARQYKTSVVTRRRAELATFQTKLAQYRTNPAVVIHGDLVDAVRVFLARENVEKFLLPPGTDTLEVLLSRDPEFSKAIERRIRQQEQERIDRERRAKQADDRFKTDTETRNVRGD
ncbi:MAG: SPFH domain-containing protein [Phycisphaerales bacterium]